MPHLVGRQAKAFILPQAVAGTAASGNHQPFDYFTPLTPRRSDELVEDPLIGRDLNNVLDAQEPAEGLVEASLNLSVPLCFSQLGLFLPQLFNAATPTGADPYTHVFTSGQREPLGASVVWAEGTKWRRAHTWTPDSMQIGVAQETGRRIVTFNGMASDIDNLASDPTGTPLTGLSRAFMPAGAGAVVRYNGTVLANLVGGDFYYRRTLEAFRPAGRADRTAKEFTPQVGASAGIENASLRIKDNVFYEIARAKTADDIEIEYSLGASASLVFTLPACRFTPTERPISGEGLRSESYTIRAEQTSGAPMVTATLINTVATYPAAA
jgi:hypothetical protein